MITLVIWKDVEGFEGLYKISNEGVLFSIPRFGVKGGVVKPYKTTNGYYGYHLSENGKLHRTSVHRLLAKHFIPNPENKPCVNHIDGNRVNNSLENLEWVTYKENTHHAIKAGRINMSGENNPQARLTDIEVSEMRDLYKHKIYNQSELAKLYGTSSATANRIVLNKTRKVVDN